MSEISFDPKLFPDLSPADLAFAEWENGWPEEVCGYCEHDAFVAGYQAATKEFVGWLKARDDFGSSSDDDFRWWETMPLGMARSETMSNDAMQVLRDKCAELVRERDELRALVAELDAEVAEYFGDIDDWGFDGECAIHLAIKRHEARRRSDG